MSGYGRKIVLSAAIGILLAGSIGVALYYVPQSALTSTSRGLSTASSSSAASSTTLSSAVTFFKVRSFNLCSTSTSANSIAPKSLAFDSGFLYFLDSASQTVIVVNGTNKIATIRAPTNSSNFGEGGLYVDDSTGTVLVSTWPGIESIGPSTNRTSVYFSNSSSIFFPNTFVSSLANLPVVHTPDTSFQIISGFNVANGKNVSFAESYYTRNESSAFQNLEFVENVSVGASATYMASDKNNATFFTEGNNGSIGEIMNGRLSNQISLDDSNFAYSGLLFDPYNQYFYVSTSNGVAALSSSSGKELANLTVPAGGGIDYLQDENGDVIAGGGLELSIIDSTTNTLVGSTSIEQYVSNPGVQSIASITYDSSNGYVYVMTNGANCQMIVLSIAFPSTTTSSQTSITYISITTESNNSKTITACTVVADSNTLSSTVESCNTAINGGLEAPYDHCTINFTLSESTLTRINGTATVIVTGYIGFSTTVNNTGETPFSNLGGVYSFQASNC